MCLRAWIADHKFYAAAGFNNYVRRIIKVKVKIQKQYYITEGSSVTFLWG